MNWYNNMKIGSKLIMGFVLVAAIAGIVGLVGIVNLQQTNKKYTALYNDFGVPLGDIADVSISFQQIRVGLRNLVLTTDSAKKDKVVTQINTYETKMQDSLSIFEGSLQTEEGKDAFATLQDALAAYTPLQEEIINTSVAGDNATAIKTLQADTSAVIVTNVTDAINVLFQLKNEKGAALAAQYAKDSSTTIVTVIIIVVGAIAFSVIFGFILSGMISKPIVKMVKIAEKVADGYLDVEIEVTSKDELGMLSAAFKKMTDNLNEVMFNISTASEQVSAGATQLSDSSMDLAQGATQQASSVEELSASIEEISSQTKLNADNAKDANEITERAKVSAIEGNKQMLEMLKAMEDINDASASISRIIKVIDDIAFQTNILALNAAVEAARAGQHGKGFAVVAEEVRNLAARSADAAKETTMMIEGSVRKAEGGTRIARDTAEALNKIVEGIGNVAELIGNINIASNEQALGIAQINQGIMQVSTVVQTNSATSQESAAASEELASQAVLLEEQVSKFKLRKIARHHAYQEYEDEKPSRVQSDKLKAKKPKKIALSDNEFGKY